MMPSHARIIYIWRSHTVLNTAYRVKTAPDLHPRNEGNIGKVEAQT